MSSRSNSRSVRNRLVGLLVDGIFLFFPMTAATVVLYDMALNGLESVFSVILLLVAGCWGVFKAVRFVTALFDNWLEERAKGIELQ